MRKIRGNLVSSNTRTIFLYTFFYKSIWGLTLLDITFEYNWVLLTLYCFINNTSCWQIVAQCDMHIIPWTVLHNICNNLMICPTVWGQKVWRLWQVMTCISLHLVIVLIWVFNINNLLSRTLEGHFNLTLIGSAWICIGSKRLQNYQVKSWFTRGD